jgi:Domain of unknown function (DUF4281)
MWDFLFSATNIWALIGWAALIFLPRLPAVLSSIMYAIVGLLCLTYIASFAALLSGSVDVGGMTTPGTSLMTIAGIRDLFATDAGVVIGWTHYLALDLFAGLWIARDADAKGFGRVAQAPILLLTLAVAPVGLLLWLIVRERRARIQAKTKTFA